MGEVWQGVHGTQGVPVAVKVITAARAQNDRYLKAFRDEVRAVAGLNHPGVVMVFDFGEVDARAEAASEGRMVAGSPYLAMELASGGSLRTRPLPTTWDDFRSDLVALLDVLSHAHARGVIHRDLKPANVLCFGSTEATGTEGTGEDGSTDTPSRPHLKLTDFGLAHAAERSQDGGIRGTSGTPTYMAPEQFLGEWRDFGPWTDLYAFGCIAYALACGTPPFHVKGFSQLMQAHLLSDPPKLVPSLPVPDGFEAWVARLMEKDPISRFQCAADAIWALRELGEPDLPTAVAPRPALPVGGGATITLTPSFVAWKEQETEIGEPGIRLRLPAASPARPQLRSLPPMPGSWRLHDASRPSMRLVGAGLGLYGLRSIPLVGREDERDAVWDALATARETRTPHLVLLKGAAGTGKSRLAQWVAQRASELGSAVVVRATHGLGGGPSDGIPRLVARATGCVGLSRAAVLQRVERWLRLRGVDDAYEWHALTEVMWPSTDAERRTEGHPVHFNRPGERYAVVQRLLGHLSRCGEGPSGTPLHRPVVVWLDDVQWGADALGLAEHLLRNGHTAPCPILVLITAREEALDDRPSESALVERLLADPHAVPVTIGPLAREHRTELVQTLLGLEGELAAEVEERTGGNPLFAVQLVGDWVQRGVLEVGDTGFVLRRGEQAVLPDDIHSMWEERIERILEAYGPDVRPVLEVAALLGTDVDDAEWRGACRVARRDIPDDLVSTLLTRRLAVPQDQGWSFTHGMLRESLERSARETGRWRTLHDACATALRIRYDAARRPGLAERLARHLVEAGREDEAIEPLRAAAVERRALSDYNDAMRLIGICERILDDRGVPDSDIRRGEIKVQRADALLAMGRLADAEVEALAAIELGRTHGWTALLAQAWRHAGSVATKRGDLDEGERRFLAGQLAAEDSGGEYARGHCLLAIGDIARARGDHATALERCREALAVFTALDDAGGQADVLLALGGVARALGRLEACDAHIRRAIPLFERVGKRFGVASCHNMLGDVLRKRELLAQAADAYHNAETILSSLGSPEQIVPRINLGLVQIARARFSKARHLLSTVLETARRDGRRGLEGALHAFLLPPVTVQGDWPRWWDHLESADDLLGATGFVDSDIAWAVQLAGDLAARAGARDQAGAAYQLALKQWRALGSEHAAEQVQRALTTL